MGKQISHAGKKQFGAYKAQNRFASNKRRKLEKHMKLFPNDKKTEAVLTDGIKNGFSYKRKSPISPIWGKGDKKLLALIHSIDGTSGKEFLTNKKDRLRVHRKDVE